MVGKLRKIARCSVEQSGTRKFLLFSSYARLEPLIKLRLGTDALFPHFLVGAAILVLPS